MAADPHWNLLTESGTGPLVLCSDFTATGRTVATFTDLAGACGLPLAWWETAPPRPGAEAGLSTADYIDRWCQQLPEPDRDVLAIAGFCVGSVFAGPLYRAVADRQHRPPLLLLFDPERPDQRLLLRHFRELLLAMRQYLNAEELAEVDRRCQLAPIQAPMPELAEVLSDWFAELTTTALGRIGLDAEHSGQVAATFRSFIGYLAAAAGIDPSQPWQQAIAFSSADEHSGLNSLPEPARIAAVATEHRFDLHHTTLLSDPRVAGEVAALLQQASSLSSRR